MALIHCNFFSESLQMSTSMHVILPENTKRQIGLEFKSTSEKYKTLFLLHGLSDDDSAWIRRTSIERYVAPLGLAVIMPNVHRSFYTDMEYGYKYWTFISEELPAVARSFFPLSDKREDNFAAGLSMGGYGAFKLVLNNPDQYCAGASLSGALNIYRLLDHHPKDFELLFSKGENLKSSNDELFHLVKKVAASGSQKPKLYQCCGTEDFLYEDNINFKKLAEILPLDYTYEEEPGTHEWGYWDEKIKNVLEWLPI